MHGIARSHWMDLEEGVGISVLHLLMEGATLDRLRLHAFDAAVYRDSALTDAEMDAALIAMREYAA